MRWYSSGQPLQNRTGMKRKRLEKPETRVTSDEDKLDAYVQCKSADDILV